MLVADVVLVTIPEEQPAEALFVADADPVTPQPATSPATGVLALSDLALRRHALIVLQTADHLEQGTSAFADVLRRFPRAQTRLSQPAEPERYEVALSVGMPGGAAARLIVPRLRPGAVDTVVGLFQNVVMRAATSQLGFRRGLLLVNRDTNRAISIGLWESRDAVRAGESNGYLRGQVEQFAAVLAEPPTSELCDVVVELAIPTLALRSRAG